MTQYQIVVGRKIQTQIREIFDYLRSKSHVESAAEIIGQILGAIHDLEFLPARFRISGVSKRRGDPIHARVVYPYIIYYTVDETKKIVLISRVIHGSRQQPSRFD